MAVDTALESSASVLSNAASTAIWELRSGEWSVCTSELASTGLSTGPLSNRIAITWHERAEICETNVTLRERGNPHQYCMHTPACHVVHAPSCGAPLCSASEQLVTAPTRDLDT